MRPVRAWIAIAGALASTVAVALPAQACTERAQISLGSDWGEAGTEVVVFGEQFDPGEEVEIRWGSIAGDVLAVVYGEDFEVAVTVPSEAAPDNYYVYALAAGTETSPPGTRAAAFEVLAPGAPPQGPVATSGEATADRRPERAAKLTTAGEPRPSREASEGAPPSDAAVPPGELPAARTLAESPDRSTDGPSAGSAASDPYAGFGAALGPGRSVIAPDQPRRTGPGAGHALAVISVALAAAAAYGLRRMAGRRMAGAEAGAGSGGAPQ